MKVVEQIPRGATTSDKFLPLLLHDALTGNSRTVLIYCINPQGKFHCVQKLTQLCTASESEHDFGCVSGVLGDETASALALAQKVRSLVTKATLGRWFPRATEQELRENIMDLQTVMMSEREIEVYTYKLAELMQNLQVAL